MKRALAIAAACLLAGCGDDVANDLGAPADLSALADAAADHGVDLAPLDATCTLQRFTGFFVGSPTEQRLDCTCGCIVDDFDSNIVNGYWGKPTAGNASYDPMPGNGLGVVVATPDGGGASIGGLNSLAPVEPFYLDGDFDLLVDWKAAALPNDAHVILTAQDGTALGHYAVERTRDVGGNDLYVATLGGIAPVSAATTATSGTLELKRTGATVQALADGAPISQFTGAGTARMSLILTVALASCSGGGCEFEGVFHHARMTRGAIVDRP
jgi:hypothetical protein